MTSTTTITNSQIRKLRIGAGQAGDLEQVAICDHALDGDGDALRQCEAVIADARAQEEPRAAVPDDDTPTHAGREVMRGDIRMKINGVEVLAECLPRADGTRTWQVSEATGPIGETAAYACIVTLWEERMRLVEALRDISADGDKTLISTDQKGCTERGINMDYSDGANTAFSQSAATATAALRAAGEEI
uniref:Uncharacterized protein n=1 Tax=viral metagenome TaxID=1070528 RepID=A0A6M3J2Q3_9ZZZZ